MNIHLSVQTGTASTGVKIWSREICKLNETNARFERITIVSQKTVNGMTVDETKSGRVSVILKKTNTQN